MPEDLGAQAHRGIGLRLAEAAVSHVSMAHPVKQRPHPTIETVLKLGVGPLRYFVDGEFAGEQPAGADNFDQRLGFRHLVGVER